MSNRGETMKLIKDAIEEGAKVLCWVLIGFTLVIVSPIILLGLLSKGLQHVWRVQP